MVAGWMLPLFLDRFGFVRNVEQSPRAVQGILLAFSIVPGVFAGLKAAALWAYPLSRREVLRIEGELRIRRQELAPGE